MKIQKICVLGGSGFVGQALVSALAGQGRKVRVLTRMRERSKELILLPTVEVVEADIHNEMDLVRQVRGMDAVVNLVGILHEKKHGQEDAPALGANPVSKSAYQRSKGAGEVIMREAGLLQQNSETLYLNGPQFARECGLNVTIFRPSVIFGRGDSFINLFAKLVRLFPIIPLANAQARFQPVWVEDVAQAFAESLEDIDSFGKTYDLCGPKIYTLKEIVEYTGHLQGKHPHIIALNDRLSYLQAWAMEFKPGEKLMTRDNYYAMQEDNVCQGEWPFKFEQATLEAEVPKYLNGQSPRARYDILRGHARRH
jgi:uncharacterized protein YbjT (DUF2867 family)